MPELPSPFHLKALWTAVAALSITVTVAIMVGVVYLGTQIIAFLQPILIPFAVAGVLAYLLDPLVVLLTRWKLSRQRAVVLVFSVFSLLLLGVLLLVAPTLMRQAADFPNEIKIYAGKASERVTAIANDVRTTMKHRYGIEVLDYLGTPGAKASPSPVKPAATPPVVTTGATEPAGDATPDTFDFNDLLSGDWLKDAATQVLPNAWGIVRRSLGGFLGVFGFLLSFFIVPLYLYYFLTESKIITARWHDYVPLRASQFKDEVVGTLTEINGYLIAFFRGQLVVSLINGVATGLGLTIVGLKFGWLIGLALCLLGMIPYLGILVCMVPALIIASVQGGCWLLPVDAPWWAFPLIVLGIFGVVQQIDGLFITPKIVGESVGLHPMTVIMSVFVWSLIMGGLLGAILAVPLTASVKVLFQRYIWHARFRREALEEVSV